MLSREVRARLRHRRHDDAAGLRQREQLSLRRLGADVSGVVDSVASRISRDGPTP